jgi:hypothetical protein
MESLGAAAAFPPAQSPAELRGFLIVHQRHFARRDVGQAPALIFFVDLQGQRRFGGQIDKDAKAPLAAGSRGRQEVAVSAVANPQCIFQESKPLRANVPLLP